MKLTELTKDQVPPIAAQLRDLYAAVYAEPPYHETESDVAEFEARLLPTELEEPSFLLVAAWDQDRLAGYLYGYAINRASPLWPEFFPSSDQDPPVAYVSELLVGAGYRGKGMARALHDRFLATRGESTAALFAHPDAIPAQTAYRRWGWHRTGTGRPWPGARQYDTLIKDLREVQRQ